MKRFLGLFCCIFCLVFTFSTNLQAMEEKLTPNKTAGFNWQEAEDDYIPTVPAEQAKEEDKSDDDSTPPTEEVSTESDEDDSNNVEEEPFYGPETKPADWVTKPIPAEDQQKIVQTKWYQKLSAAVKSGALKIQEGYHTVCNGITLVKDKTINGAKYLINTKTGRSILVMSVVGGCALVINLYVPEPMQVPGNFTHTDL